MRLRLMAAALLATAQPVLAQESAAPQTAPQTDSEWMAWVPSEAEIALPELAFVEDQEDRDNYEKYYYFHRSNTDFATALADLRECDAHARGLYRGNAGAPDMSAAMVQYGLVAGAAGGLIGAAIADAIMGPAELRRKRRVNMRRCMFFLGYSRFGLDKTVWETLNFEEGAREVAEADRQKMLAQQARVASGPRPTATEIGL